MILTGKRFYYTFPDESLIKEDIFRDMNKILKEEMGVADKVITAAEEIERLITDDMKNRKKEYNDMIKHNILVGNLVYRAFNSFNLTINYCFIYLKDLNDYVESKKNGFFDSNSGFKKIGHGKKAKEFAMVSLNIPVISGKIDYGELFDSLQHEIEHIYQQSLKGDSYPNTGLYAKNVSDFSTNENNTARHMVSYLMYLSNPYEQDAYANGLYSSIVNTYGEDKNKTFDDLLKQSQAYDRLKKMKTYIEQLSIQSMQEEVENVLKGYKKSMKKSSPFGNSYLPSRYDNYNQFIKTMEKSLDRFETKVMKAFMLAKTRLMDDSNDSPKDVVESLHRKLLHPIDWQFFEVGKGF